MRTVDPLDPGRRLTGVSHSDAEVATLAEAFNGMLDRLEQERRGSVRRALAAQEEERSRIARELHDELGQELTAVAMQSERAAHGAPADSQAALEEIAEATRQASTTCAASRAAATRGTRRPRPGQRPDLALPTHGKHEWRPHASDLANELPRCPRRPNLSSTALPRRHHQRPSTRPSVEVTLCHSGGRVS